MEKGQGFIIQIYNETKQFPNDKKFGLTSQVCRATVSITSNIVEGALRKYSEKQA